MTEEVIPSQMLEENVLVQESGVAELAEGMAAVRSVVGIALAAVSCQL